MTPRLLLIDDDRELCDLLTEFLSSEGYEIRACHAGDAGLAAVVADPPDLVVLDVMLPGLGGLDVLREIRARLAVPVVMLTARGEEVDRIVGLELGADDYLPKPFNPRELAARIRAVLRRVDGAGPRGLSERVRVGDVELDPGARVAWRGGAELELTGVEFSLLERLVRGAGQVMSRDELSREVLGRRASSFDRSLDVHISNLRRKLGPRSDGGDRLKTVRGVGYQYVRPADDEPGGDR
jgi:two-component system response regulator CpxR